MSLKIVIGENKTPWDADFESGSRVEVTSDEDGYLHSWFAAKTIGSVGRDKLLVEYFNLVTDDGAQPLRCEAEIRHVRPEPPPFPLETPLMRLQAVDAWYNEGWWEGVVTQIRPGGAYAVYFQSTDEEMVFRRGELRPHLDWVYGQWLIDSEEINSEDSSCEDVVTGKTTAAFDAWTEVEMRSDEEGYEGAWYTAKIVAPLAEGKFAVEYQTLKSDDGTKWLNEVARSEDIRPCPSDKLRVFGFVLGENVDGWFKGGLWSGTVSRVLADQNYLVYFASTEEEIVFSHYRLRPHQEWRRGKWIYSPML